MIIDNVLSLIILALSGKRPLLSVSSDDKLIVHPRYSYTDVEVDNLTLTDVLESQPLVALLAKQYNVAWDFVIFTVKKAVYLLQSHTFIPISRIDNVKLGAAVLTIWNYADTCCLWGDILPKINSNLIIDGDLVDCSGLAHYTNSAILLTNKPFRWKASGVAVPNGLPIRIVTKSGKVVMAYNTLQYNYPVVVYTDTRGDYVVQTRKEYVNDYCVLSPSKFVPEYLQRELR